jgi:ABC-type glutathione transport system ATPase component
MKHTQNNYFRFVSLRLRDYKMFRGVNDFSFSRRRTLILGKNGIGKTTISGVLECLGASQYSKLPFNSGDKITSYVAVVTEGNCELVKKYRDIMFINGESPDMWIGRIRRSKFKDLFVNRTWGAVERNARLIFKEIIANKPGKADLCREIDTSLMAGGERVCFGYALVFALRRMLKLDIPIVLDAPYARLDCELRMGLSNFLKAQPYQQILLGYESEFAEEEKPKYILVYAEDHSHVMEY